MMPKLFEFNEFLIDEKVNFAKFENEYKIFNNQAQQVGFVKQKLSIKHKILQLLINKAMMPFVLDITDSDGKVLLSIKRGWTFWMSKIQIIDSNGNILGFINQKFKFFKPTFKIINTMGMQVAEITGDWKAWNFDIKNNNGISIGLINKKWAGVMKEIFTTADKYFVSIKPEYAEDSNKVIILATAITIDMVLKESK